MRHLAHALSDHCPLLLEVNGLGEARVEERPFRFQMAWLLHEDFFKMMERDRVRGVGLTCSLKCFTKKLAAWNRHTFGNISRRKRGLRRRLEGVERALDLKTSVGLLKLESKSRRNGLRC